jgi:hypothetical protein
MPSGSGKRRKRKRRQAARPPAERGYAGARAKDEEARSRLKPLPQGERPTAVTVAAVVAFVLGVANLGLYAAGVEINGQRPGPLGIVVYSGILLLTAWGMWRARYWAVLGMQALLAITLLAFGVLLVKAESVAAAVIALVILASSGTLFWFLIKAMARIQMPERPGANR